LAKALISVSEEVLGYDRSCLIWYSPRVQVKYVSSLNEGLSEDWKPDEA